MCAAQLHAKRNATVSAGVRSSSPLVYPREVLAESPATSRWYRYLPSEE